MSKWKHRKHHTDITLANLYGFAGVPTDGLDAIINELENAKTEDEKTHGLTHGKKHFGHTGSQKLTHGSPEIDTREGQK